MYTYTVDAPRSVHMRGAYACGLDKIWDSRTGISTDLSQLSVHTWYIPLGYNHPPSLSLGKSGYWSPALLKSGVSSHRYGNLSHTLCFDQVPHRCYTPL